MVEMKLKDDTRLRCFWGGGRIDETMMPTKDGRRPPNARMPLTMMIKKEEDMIMIQLERPEHSMPPGVQGKNGAMLRGMMQGESSHGLERTTHESEGGIRAIMKRRWWETACGGRGAGLIATQLG